MEIEAEVDLYASIGNAVKDGFKEAWQQYVGQRKIWTYNFKRGGIMPTPNTSDLVLVLGSPAASRVWDVRHVVVSRSNPETNDTSGKVFVCAGMIPGPGQLIKTDPHDPFNVWTSTNNIPADCSFGQLEMTVRHNQDLFVIFTGYTAGVGLACHAQVVDYPEWLWEEAGFNL